MKFGEMNNAGLAHACARLDEPDFSGDLEAENREEAIGQLAAKWETDPDAIFDALESLAINNKDPAVGDLARLMAEYMKSPEAWRGWQVVGQLRVCLEAKLERMAAAEIDGRGA